MWKRAVWLEGKTEEEGVVPSSWVVEQSQTVFWPQGCNAENALLSQQDPDPKTWRKFHLQKVKVTSDSYGECDNSTLTSTLETSEYSSDDEGYGKRKRIKKNLPEDFVSSQDLRVTRHMMPVSEQTLNTNLPENGAPGPSHKVLPTPPPKVPLNPEATKRSGTEESGTTKATSKTRSISPNSDSSWEKRSGSREACDTSSDRSDGHYRGKRHSNKQNRSDTCQGDKRDRSESPDYRGKRSSNKWDHRGKRQSNNRDRSDSPDHRRKRNSDERGRSNSPDHRGKRQSHKRDQSDSPDYRGKRQSKKRDQSDSPDQRSKQDSKKRDRSDSPDHREKRGSNKRDQSESPNHRSKQDSNKRDQSGRPSEASLEDTVEGLVKEVDKFNCPMDCRSFQRRVFQQLLEIKTLCNQNLTRSDDGDKLNRTIKRSDSVEAAQVLENELNDQRYFISIRNQCVRIGGCNMRDIISNLMCRFMTKTLMCKYNMLGQRGKLAFSKLKLYSIIQESVLQKFSNSTEFEIQHFVAAKLRNAPKLKADEN